MDQPQESRGSPRPDHPPRTGWAAQLRSARTTRRRIAVLRGLPAPPWLPFLRWILGTRARMASLLSPLINRRSLVRHGALPALSNDPSKPETASDVPTARGEWSANAYKYGNQTSAPICHPALGFVPHIQRASFGTLAIMLADGTHALAI